MKKLELVALFFLMLLAACSTDSDDSDDFDASVVCPAEGTNAYGMPNRGTFVDERDGQVYKYTTIGNQVWMAENLRYKIENSVCYKDLEEECERSGRLYALTNVVMYISGMLNDSLGTKNQAMIDSVCPPTWHVPSLAEWETLEKSFGKDVGKKIFNEECSFSSAGRGEGFRAYIGNNSSYRMEYTAGKGLCFATTTMNTYNTMWSVSYFKDGINKEYSSVMFLSIRCIKD